MDENMEKARELVTALVQTNIERFMNHGGFLSPQWWLLVAFTIVPWVIWVKIVDKKRKLELVVVGLFIAIVTKLLDLVGYNLNYWDYPIQMIPLVPEAFAFDLSMVPVAYMLLYQYFKTWKSYCLGLLCMSVIYAFIGEPFCNLIMVVAYFKWKYIYSFLYYNVIGITVRTIADNLKRTYEGLNSYPAKEN
ncbi:CBO0543 family protein [Paenibacillus aestuarii]|uniref:CBO0543 family protein n=1 Tax=Paenibacillus aestuarii TaxID=516965 RepID=A0ABW0KEC3_9BACL|nr:CBO0543 family protein [Paenibacillus aestuarii]